MNFLIAAVWFFIGGVLFSIKLEPDQEKYTEIKGRILASSTRIIGLLLWLIALWLSFRGLVG